MLEEGYEWFKKLGWKVAPFQAEAWQAYTEGRSGIVNAPTGSGKTYSLLVPILLSGTTSPSRQERDRPGPLSHGERGKRGAEHTADSAQSISHHVTPLPSGEGPGERSFDTADSAQSTSPQPSPARRGSSGLRATWITPIRALAKEIHQSAERAIEGLGLDWTVGIRTGDTKSAERAKQKTQMPNLLITTPESLHLLLASKGYPKTFKNLECVVVDEWHELMGSKRAVQMELALSRLRGMNPALRTWGISATIGNMEEAMEVLMGSAQNLSPKTPTYRTSRPKGGSATPVGESAESNSPKASASSHPSPRGRAAGGEVHSSAHTQSPKASASRLPLSLQERGPGLPAGKGRGEVAQAAPAPSLPLLPGEGRGEVISPVVIKANIRKKILVKTVLPDEVETLPWAGHLGIKMLKKVLPIIEKSQTTLIFTNTRSQTEIWYQRLLEADPNLAGQMAMHHGSISRELRFWVEDALHSGLLKVVVCTSSLDLGVDFRPVETIIQVGSPKGVGRFMQRAGRSGHSPGATSRIYFVPTHSLELVEAAALRQAIKEEMVEERTPYVRSFDVLIQYLVTLAVSEGFDAQEIFREVKSTFSYSSISWEEWQWCLSFITTGGKSLSGYDEFHKVEKEEDGTYKVSSRKVAQRHRMSIGTIVGDASLRVKFQSGGYLGTLEEHFIAKLKPGDTFSFAGRNLELIRVRGMEVTVRLSKAKTAKVASWGGSRMPLSAKMGAMLRSKLDEAFNPKRTDPELRMMEPLFALQRERSVIPKNTEFLIEKFKSRDGYHVFFYPFEGRLVHEGMATVLAYRISLFKPLTFSIALNDYGFELLADSPIPIEEAVDSDVFTLKDLREDILQSVNAVEMARRRFRDIASIAGMVWKGYPGQQIKDRHLQSSTQLIFNVFQDYEPDNILLQQAYEEALDFQLEEGRLRLALERINKQTILIQELQKPSPFSFPIMVDRLSREKLTSETIEDRVKRMKVAMGE